MFFPYFTVFGMEKGKIFGFHMEETRGKSCFVGDGEPVPRVDVGIDPYNQGFSSRVITPSTQFLLWVLRCVLP